MDAKKWKYEADLESMLAFVVPRISDRKLRLYAAHCCRRVESMMSPELIESLNLAIELADGNIQQKRRKQARFTAFNAEWGDNIENQVIALGQGAAKMAVVECLQKKIRESHALALSFARDAARTLMACHDPAAHLLSRAPGHGYTTAFASAEKAAQAGMLKHFTGSLSWLTSEKPEITFSELTVSLARQIYDAQEMTSVGDLFNALSDEPGVEDSPVHQTLLDHFNPDRGNLGRLNANFGSFHPRGCWALDFILSIEPSGSGKE